MTDTEKPTIAFLTGPWSNIDDNIRKGMSPGGVPSVAGAWIACHKARFEVHVFIVTQTEPGWPKETTELDGIHLHWISQPFQRLTNWVVNNKLIGLVKPLWLIWQLQMVWRILTSRVRPNIVYSMRSTFVLVGCIWSKICGAKFVQRQYGTWLYHLWFEQNKWLPRIKSLGTLLAFKFPTDLYIMTNDGTNGDKVAEWLSFPMDRFRFWLNGVDKSLRIKDFDVKGFKKELGLPWDSYVIMTLGRLSYWKRLDRAIDAMAVILKEYPNAYLVIIGKGEKLKILEEQVEALGLNNNVIFLGAVQHNKIKRYLNGADIFLMCNDLTNMCNTLVEALTCGCCVVTRDVGSTTEIVTDGDNAIVLKPGEAGDIASAIIALLKNPRKRQEIAERAYKKAMEQFQTWDERMKMEVEELEMLIGKTG
jgi:glycosyltransferase involved in cell wall biosynthesis